MELRASGFGVVNFKQVRLGLRLGSGLGSGGVVRFSSGLGV